MLAVLTVQAQKREAQLPHLSAIMVLFALIFTPQSYIIFGAVRYGAQLRTLCLIAMLVFALTTPWPEMELAPDRLRERVRPSLPTELPASASPQPSYATN
jgi:hypothetical protein